MNNTTLTDILIVEDNADLQELYRFAFENAGYTVHTANDGLQGVTMAAKIKPSVILLDLMMPNVDGFEVLGALQKNVSLLSTNIFVISNLNDPQHMQRALANNAAEFLKKADYTPDQVVQHIESYLRDGPALPAAGEALAEPVETVYRVLLVEDNDDQAELLSLGLEQKGMQVSVAKDGPEGVNQAIAEKPNVILLDISLPTMDGFAVLKTLHSEVKLPVPIIITSQMDSPAEEARAEALGATMFLKKSEYMPEQIAEKVLDYLEAELMS